MVSTPLTVYNISIYHVYTKSSGKNNRIALIYCRKLTLSILKFSGLFEKGGVVLKNDKLMKDAIIETFGYGNVFTSKELLKFYKVNEDGLKESTFRWRVYALKKDGLISNIKRGSYILDHKKTFKQQVLEEVLRGELWYMNLKKY
jgi:hypothetical protein